MRLRVISCCQVVSQNYSSLLYRGGFPLLFAPCLTCHLLLKMKDFFGECYFLIPPWHITLKWITKRYQPNQKLALAFMLCTGSFENDILACVVMGGNDRNFRGGVYSLYSNFLWNTPRRVKKQAMLSQCLCWQHEMEQTGKSECTTVLIMVVCHFLS